MFISSYLYLKQYETDRTNKSNVYNEYILIQKIWTICDPKTHSRRKTYQVRYAPQNVHMCTICAAKRPHAYVLRYGRLIAVLHSSPLFFMLFVKDILDNINTDLDGIFTIN
jgi:hypothetical protein